MKSSEALSLESEGWDRGITYTTEAEADGVANTKRDAGLDSCVVIERDGGPGNVTVDKYVVYTRRR